MNVLNAIVTLGRDSELRYLADGTPTAQFSAALQSGYGDKQVTTWLNCQIWGKRAETLSPMLLKGQRIGITGELTNRPYKAKDGTDKYSLEVRINDVTLLTKRDNAEANTSAPVNEKYELKGGRDGAFDDFEDAPF